jgi:antibiotic biosynthesis monooxygenase (ABM) superfamily enzyme
VADRAAGAPASALPAPAALLTGLIVMTMTWVVMPRLTKLMRGFLNPHLKK